MNEQPQSESRASGSHRAPTPGPGIRSRSITRVLASALVLSTLIPFLPLGYFTWSGYRQDAARIERDIGETNRQVAHLGAIYLEELLAQVGSDASIVADDLDRLPPQLRAVRWERTTRSGDVVASQIDQTRVGQPGGYQRYLDQSRATTAPGWSTVDRWLAALPPTTVFAVPAQHGQAFLVAVIDPRALHAELTAWSGAQVDRHVYVVDQIGRLIFYSESAISDRGVDLSNNPPVKMHLAGEQGPLRFRSVVSGKDRLGWVRPVQGTGWSVIVSADLGTHLLDVRSRYLVLGWTIVFALLAVAAIQVWASRRLVRPLLDFVQALRSSGQHRKLLPVSAATYEIAEYRELADAFNALQAVYLATERELLHAEKSSLLGQLASGIAHEIGTPLNVISGNAQYAMRKLAADDPARSTLQQVVRQAERIAGLIRSLLDFARPTEVRLVPIDLSRVVEQTLEMVTGMTRKLQLRVDIDPETPPVIGDPKLLEHALLNLIVNACQATPDGGTLSIIVGTGLEPASVAGAEQWWVCCRVVDSGSGIAPEHMAHLFEPFFTTKPPGQGTGLGLAIVDRIVKAHDGRIDVASRVGHGTVFTVRLKPVAGAAAAVSKPAARAGAAVEEASRT